MTRKSNLSPFTASMKLAAKAFEYSTDKNGTTPFSR